MVCVCLWVCASVHLCTYVCVRALAYVSVLLRITPRLCVCCANAGIHPQPENWFLVDTNKSTVKCTQKLRRRRMIIFKKNKVEQDSGVVTADSGQLWVPSLLGVQGEGELLASVVHSLVTIPGPVNCSTVMFLQMEMAELN